MIGAIAGDIVGSRFEFDNIKTKWFRFFTEQNCFTDDTVMTCCVAEALRLSWEKDKFETLDEMTKSIMQGIGQWYPNCGYGAKFIKWMYAEDPQPYDSCGNGSAMRISPVGDIARSIEEAKELSYKVTAISHNHPEGIKGAEATAVASYLLRTGHRKNEVKSYIEDHYYDLSMSVRQYREEVFGHGKEICQITVPQAFACFFEGYSYRDVIRNCMSIGGDSDTIGAIAGGLAESFYGVPDKVKYGAMSYLDAWLYETVLDFEQFRKDFV